MWIEHGTTLFTVHYRQYVHKITVNALSVTQKMCELQNLHYTFSNKNSPRSVIKFTGAS